MISECLQKDPSKRPTASELLKHAFFKNKSKDRKYLQSVLVNNAPNLEARVTRRQSRKPGTSGRLHRNETGDWVWSSDEEGDSDDETIQKKGMKVPKHVSKSEESLPENQRTINLVLRMRNTRRELNDIRFEFQPTKDSADGIANELLSAGLIVGDDLVAMAANLDKLITNPPPNKHLTFRISAGINQQETPDEKALLGFAQLSIAD